MKFTLIAGLLSVALSAQAQLVPLWPEGVPATPMAAAAQPPAEPATPSLTVFPAGPDRPSGSAVIIAPGGGYSRLSTAREGEQMARWLSGLGVTAFVLTYRVAPNQHPAALQDVLRAVRLVRSQAAQYKIDPARIGVMGFSAGGHVAASAATLYDHADGRTGAQLDSVSARPDFLILLYPVITFDGPAAHARSRAALLGASPSPELVRQMSPDLQVTRNTPPTLLIHTQEDGTVKVENSILFYQALTRNKVPAEMILYEKGGHGMGMRPGLGTTSEWPRRAEEWLREHKLIVR